MADASWISWPFSFCCAAPTKLCVTVDSLEFCPRESSAQYLDPSRQEDCHQASNSAVGLPRGALPRVDFTAARLGEERGGGGRGGGGGAWAPAEAEALPRVDVAAAALGSGGQWVAEGEAWREAGASIGSRQMSGGSKSPLKRRGGSKSGGRPPEPLGVEDRLPEPSERAPSDELAEAAAVADAAAAALQVSLAPPLPTAVQPPVAAPPPAAAPLPAAEPAPAELPAQASAAERLPEAAPPPAAAAAPLASTAAAPAAAEPALSAELAPAASAEEPRTAPPLAVLSSSSSALPRAESAQRSRGRGAEAAAAPRGRAASVAARAAGRSAPAAARARSLGPAGSRREAGGAGGWRRDLPATGGSPATHETSLETPAVTAPPETLETPVPDAGAVSAEDLHAASGSAANAKELETLATTAPSDTLQTLDSDAGAAPAEELHVIVADSQLPEALAAAEASGAAPAGEAPAAAPAGAAAAEETAPSEQLLEQQPAPRGPPTASLTHGLVREGTPAAGLAEGPTEDAAASEQPPEQPPGPPTVSLTIGPDAGGNGLTPAADSADGPVKAAPPLSGPVRPEGARPPGGGSIAQRARAYEAACRSTPEKQPPMPGKAVRLPGGSQAQRAEAYEAACRSAPGQEERASPELERIGRLAVGSAQAYEEACRLRQEREALEIEKTPPLGRGSLRGATPDTGDSKPERPLRKLSNVTEQRVLKTGLLKLVELLVSGRDVSLAELPCGPNGAPKVLQSRSFLRRLLSNEVELKGCMESDVSAAQSDLRHLSPEQLLSIRGRTLDFATEAQSHSARNGFLELVDKHLFGKLARRMLRGEVAEPSRPEALHALGLRATLTLGVATLLRSGWGKPTGAEATDLPPMPVLWVVRLNELEWPDACRAAVFHDAELWLRPLPGQAPDFAGACAGESLAAACDRTTGVGKDRMLHWEIAVLDPASDDVMAELDRDPGDKRRRCLNDELSATLAQRAARTM